jgi:hypothetical protein
MLQANFETKSEFQKTHSTQSNKVTTIIKNIIIIKQNPTAKVEVSLTKFTWFAQQFSGTVE